MLKEIFEQPDAVRATVQDRIINNKVPKQILGPNSEILLSKFKVVQIIACGTSYHAASGKTLAERLARNTFVMLKLPVSSDIEDMLFKKILY